MNLGKLLGTGKSFISGGKPAAYREDKRFYLPQFVSPKNPFANPGPVSTQVELPKSPAPGSVAPPKKAAPWVKTQKIPAVATRGATGAGDDLDEQIEPGFDFWHRAGSGEQKCDARAGRAFPGKSESRPQ